MKRKLCALQVVLCALIALNAAAVTYTIDSPGWAMRSISIADGGNLTSSTLPSQELPATAGQPIFHLDASDTNGWDISVVNGTKFVTKCPSATGNGRYLEYLSETGFCVNGPFLLENDPELQGGRTLDFGKQGSRLGLYFDGGRLEGIGTIIAVWGSQNGGGWVLGGGCWTNESDYVHSGYGFHRGPNPVIGGDNSIISASRVFKSPAYPAVVESHCWLDGVEVMPLDMGFSGNYQLLSVVCAQATSWAAGVGINDTRMSGRSGGQRIAEMIIYPTLLTDADRRLVEAYLTQKWFGRPYAGYNRQATLAEAKLSEFCSIEVSEAETLRITRVFDNGSTQQNQPPRLTLKKGAGTLEIADSAGLAAPFEWWAGGLSLPRRPVPKALPSDPVFRVDASQTNSVDCILDSEGVLRVTAWRDADGRSFAAAPPSAANRPSLLQEALNGKPVIDFGQYASGQFLQWNTNMAYIGTVLWVVGAQNGGGHLLGRYSDNTRFQRGGHGASQTSPLWSATGYKITMRECPTYINGLRVNSTNACLSSSYQVVAVQAPGAHANQFAGHNASDTKTSNTGGQRLAEVVVYNRHLSEREIEDAQAYLMRKWFNSDTPGYVRQSRSRPDIQGVSHEGQGALVVDNDAISIGELRGIGTLTKKGQGTLELQGASAFHGTIDVQDGHLQTGVPSVSEGQPAADPVFHLDAVCSNSLETITQNGTNFITQWTDISGWRNSARRFSTDVSRPLPWLRADDPANGHPVVDFGVRGSCRALVFDKPVNHIRAAYIVIGTQDGCGNFLLGSTPLNSICDFHRGGTDTQDDPGRALLSGHGFTGPLRNGLIYTNGVSVDHSAGLSGGYQLVELHPTSGTRASALACDRYWGNIDVGNLDNESIRRTGGQRLGEVLLYDRPLTARERVATRNYLMAKWFGETPAPLPEDSPVVVGTVLTDDSASVTTARVDTAVSLSLLSGQGVFEKTGAATLTIADISAYTGTLRVAQGTVNLTGVVLTEKPTLVTDGLAFHADATQNVEWELENGVRRVTLWGSAVGDGWFAYAPVNKPEYKRHDHTGLPVVDLGAMGSQCHLLFCNTNSAVGVTDRIMNIRSVFWVMGSQNGGGYLLGGGTNASQSAQHYNFHRGDKPGGNMESITYDHYLLGWSADAAIQSATTLTYLNGVEVNPFYTGLSGGYDLIGMVLNEGATEAEGFAFDGRFLDNGSYPGRTGGQRLAEVLIYNRPVSEAERINIENYLRLKWALKPYRASADSALTLSLAQNTVVDMSGTTQAVAHVTGVGVARDGTLHALDGISAGEIAGAAATLTVDGGLMIGDDSVLTVDLTSAGADCVTVTGACRVGKRVTVSIQSATALQGGAFYQAPLIEAGELMEASNLSSWRVAGNVPAGSTATLYPRNETVWLKVARGGMLILLR